MIRSNYVRIVIYILFLFSTCINLAVAEELRNNNIPGDVYVNIVFISSIITLIILVAMAIIALYYINKTGNLKSAVDRFDEFTRQQHMNTKTV